MSSDPPLSSEAQFQSAALSAIRAALGVSAHSGLRCEIIAPFGLDAAILIQARAGVRIHLLEFKAYKGQRQGGVGFGSPKGEGPQVELLMLPDSLLSQLDRTIRWCFADLTVPPGAPRYAVITSAEAKHAAMGEIRHGKQNNFRIKVVLAKRLSWTALIEELVAWLTTSDGPPGS